MALQSTTAISTITLQESSTEVTFSSIPATYRDLILVIDGTPNGINPMDIDLNGDTTNANYFGVHAYNQGGTTTSFTTNETYIGVNYYSSNGQTNVIVQFQDYSATDKHKSYITRSNGAGNWIAMSAINWTNTDAITSIAINLRGGSFAAGDTFSLFGRIA